MVPPIGPYVNRITAGRPPAPRIPARPWENGRAMPMRTDCKNYETRTYRTGETVRKCNLDLAPEAPWRCPENCEGFELRMADVNWTYGSLITPPTPEEPPGLGQGAAELLDAAEDIVNAAGREILEEMSRTERRKPMWRRFLGR